ncbi:exonuclease domain-containing protein [Saccharopolyspora sp. NPDC047091]|uniref:exonuclease domain-containing protein n=1 Tax=Saccharopolyspora sp. NPDC047091 TaxID=3155924 RepID=UPI0033D6DAF7
MSWGFAVIDVETTGLRLRSRHRIAEIAVVLLDPSGAVQEEWCTLIDPQRDPGPQHVHGISAADARNAPVFAEIAPELSRLFCPAAVPVHRSAAAANAMPVPPLTVDLRLAPRDSVVFTGETTSPRAQWIDRAERAGLTVQEYVTEKTRLLMAADADSQSRKAETARKYGIPIVTEHGFSQLLDGLDLR